MQAAAMILAAGRGERMRPLSEAKPKPLLDAGGKPLIVWQVEALARAGFRHMVINAAYRAEDLEAALGDGGAHGVSIAWSIEPEPLEVAGGIAHALPLLDAAVLLVVSADVWSTFDYATLAPRAAAMAASTSPPHMHMVMVPNPDFHPDGDFALDAGRLAIDGPARLTFANIALYRRALFEGMPRSARRKIRPLYDEWIGRGDATGELFTGAWSNVGTPADLARLDSALRSGGGRPTGANR